MGCGVEDRGDPRSAALPKFSWGNFPPRAAAPSSRLCRHEARGPRHPAASPSPAPHPRAGPPALSGSQRAAAAGLGPLAGYCRRIYCIAACAGCSPAHNRLAVAQGSTLRGKVGFRRMQIAGHLLQYTAGAGCSLRTPPSPCSSPGRGALRGSCVPSSSPRQRLRRMSWRGCSLRLWVPRWPGGHHACPPS